MSDNESISLSPNKPRHTKERSSSTSKMSTNNVNLECISPYQSEVDFNGRYDLMMERANRNETQEQPPAGYPVRDPVREEYTLIPMRNSKVHPLVPPMIIKKEEL
jgi:hypothetical protein